WHEADPAALIAPPGQPAPDKARQVTVGDERVLSVPEEEPVEVEITLVVRPAVERVLVPNLDPGDEAVDGVPGSAGGVPPPPQAQLAIGWLQVPVVLRGRAGEVDPRPGEREVVGQRQLELPLLLPASGRGHRHRSHPGVLAVGYEAARLQVVYVGGFGADEM